MGYTLKNRYKSLLPAGGSYTKKNTRVVSSPRQRCVDSVNSLLKCMTARKVRSGWRYKKQPVSFTKLKMENDNVRINRIYINWEESFSITIMCHTPTQILLQSKSCPKYDVMVKNLIKKPKRGSAIYNFNKKHARLYSYVSRHTGEVKYQSVICLIYLFSLWQLFWLFCSENSWFCSAWRNLRCTTGPTEP